MFDDPLNDLRVRVARVVRVGGSGRDTERCLADTVRRDFRQANYSKEHNPYCNLRVRRRGRPFHCSSDAHTDGTKERSLRV